MEKGLSVCPGIVLVSSVLDMLPTVEAKDCVTIWLSVEQQYLFIYLFIQQFTNRLSVWKDLQRDLESLFFTTIL